MIESVLHPRNLMRAYYQVVRNKGASGVDGMSVDELKEYLSVNRQSLETLIREDKYLPHPILGIEIPKSNGDVRLLGVPVVIDRMLQQAVGQILCNYYDTSFEDYSYGFRPNRKAHQAVLRSQEYINGGNNWVVDIDLKNFFDEVDHCLLLQILYRRIKCGTTLRLIRKWLRAPIQIQGRLTKRRKGVPQGSPLSPILSNILLNELDKEMEKMSVKYVRYADDFSIYCREEQTARDVGNQIYLYLKDKLHLPINREKSGIRRPEEFTILGYGFERLKESSAPWQYQLIVSNKKWKPLKHKLKEITRKTTPYSFDTRVRKLKEVQRGWVQYFGLAHMNWQLKKLDKWVRSRLRYCIWHDWKKPSRRRKNLLRLGVKPHNAQNWSQTRMGGWATARSPILTTTITMARLRKRGYEAMFPIYQSITPYLNEPLYT
ncbi:group II intron reverse transcriptase/maturase [Bacteroides sp. 519]|uniref:group II intron reverse transcriptase/maturase n=1 Tax=Bacteroides sp. 519 TaxID=2302937 RepID=UPI0013D55606|nr:group II intron reverse transcriptase/maturase [Bacteroides sp. 519]NDV60781.1 group II intron reverse transcriptase/maturase [Bacteroides sp. 519]